MISFVLAGAVEARNNDVYALGDEFYKTMHARDFQLSQTTGGRDIGSVDELEALLEDKIRRSFGTAASSYINRSMRWGGEYIFGKRFRSHTNLRWDIGEGFRGDFQLGLPLLPASWSDNNALQLQTGLVLWEGHRGNQRTDINIGLVGRHRVRGTDPLAFGMGEVIYGISLFYDINTETDLDRLGVGVDLQARRAMLAFNSYFPVDGDDWSDGEDGYEERAATGFELRGRYEFIDNANLHLSLGMWQDTDLPDSGKGADDYVFAGTVGADWWFHPNFGVNAAYEYGPYALDDGRYLVGMEARWPGRILGRIMGSGRPDLFALVERENRILYQERKRLTLAQSEQLLTGLSIGFSGFESLQFIESAQTDDGLDITINRFSIVTEAPAALDYVVYTSLDEDLCVAPCVIPAGVSKATTPADFIGRTATAPAARATAATGKITIAEGETSPPAASSGVLTTPHALNWLRILNDNVNEEREYFLLVIAPTPSTKTTLDNANLPSKPLVRVVQIVPEPTRTFSANVPPTVIAGGQGTPQLTGFSFTATDPLQQSTTLRLVLGRPGTVAVAAPQSGGVQGQTSSYRRVAAGEISQAEAQQLAIARQQASGVRGQSGGVHGQQDVLVNQKNTCSIDITIDEGQTSFDENTPLDLTACYTDLEVTDGKREKLELRLDIPRDQGPLFAPRGNKINDRKAIEVIVPPAPAGDDEEDPDDVQPITTEYEEDSEVTLVRADASRHTIALATHGADADGKFAEPEDAADTEVATIRLTLNTRVGDNDEVIAAPDIPVGTQVCYETISTESAIAGEDFEAVIPDDDNSHCVASVFTSHVDLPVTILFDEVTEEDETFSLRVISIDENAAEADKRIDTTVFGTDDAPGDGLSPTDPIIIAANGRVTLVAPPPILRLGEFDGSASLALGLTPNGLPEDLVLDISFAAVSGANLPTRNISTDEANPTANWDYAMADTITIPAGAVGATVPIELNDDNLLEGLEQVALTLTYPATFSEEMQAVLDPAIVANAGQAALDEPITLDIGDDEGPVVLKLYRFTGAEPDPTQDELISSDRKVLYIEEPSGTVGTEGPVQKFYYQVVSEVTNQPVNMPANHAIVWNPVPTETTAERDTDYTLTPDGVTILGGASISGVFELKAVRNNSPQDKRIFNRPDINRNNNVQLVDIIAPTDSITPFEIIFTDQTALPQLTLSGPRADGDDAAYAISTAITTPLEFAVDEGDGEIKLTFNLTKGFKTNDRDSVFEALTLTTEDTASTTDTVVKADFLDGGNGKVKSTDITERAQRLSVDGRNICNNKQRNGCSFVWKINDDALIEDDEVFFRTINVAAVLQPSAGSGALAGTNFDTAVDSEGKVKIPVKLTIKNDDVIERFVLLDESGRAQDITPETYSVPEVQSAPFRHRIAVQGANGKEVIPTVPLRFKYSTLLENSAAKARICTGDGSGSDCSQTGTFNLAPGASAMENGFLINRQKSGDTATSVGAPLPDEGLFFKVFEVKNNVETRVEASNGSNLDNKYKFDSAGFFDGNGNNWEVVSGGTGTDSNQTWALRYSVEREFKIGGYEIPRALALDEAQASDPLELMTRSGQGRNTILIPIDSGIEIGIPISVEQPSAAGEGQISIQISDDDDFVLAGTACATAGACLLASEGFISNSFTILAAADANADDATATLILGAPVGASNFGQDIVKQDLKDNPQRIPLSIADKDADLPTLRFGGNGERLEGDIAEEKPSAGSKINTKGRIADGELADTLNIPIRLSKAFTNSDVSLSVTPSLVAVADDALSAPNIDAASVAGNDADVRLASSAAVVLDNDNLSGNIGLQITQNDGFEDEEEFIVRLTTNLNGVPDGQTGADVYAGLVGEAVDILFNLPDYDGVVLGDSISVLSQGRATYESNGNYHRIEESSNNVDVTLSVGFASAPLDKDVEFDLRVEYKDSAADLAEDALPDYQLLGANDTPTDKLVIPANQGNGSVKLRILPDNAVERSATMRDDNGYFESLTVIVSYPEDVVAGLKKVSLPPGSDPNDAVFEYPTPGEEFGRVNFRIHDRDATSYLVPYLVVGEKDSGSATAGDDIALDFGDNASTAGHRARNEAATRLFEDGDVAEIYYRMTPDVGQTKIGGEFIKTLAESPELGRGRYLAKAPSNDLIINLEADPRRRLDTLAVADRNDGLAVAEAIGRAKIGVDYVMSRTQIRFPSGPNAVSESFTITTLDNTKRDKDKRRLAIGIRSISQNGTVFTDKPLWMQALESRNAAFRDILRPSTLFIVDDDTAPNLKIGGASAQGYIGDLRTPTSGATIEAGANTNNVTPRRYTITATEGEGGSITVPVSLTEDFSAADINLAVTATIGATPTDNDVGMTLAETGYEASLSDSARLLTQTVNLDNANKTGSFTIHIREDDLSEGDETLQIGFATALTQDGSALDSSSTVYIGGQGSVANVTLTVPANDLVRLRHKIVAVNVDTSAAAIAAGSRSASVIKRAIEENPDDADDGNANDGETTFYLRAQLVCLLVSECSLDEDLVLAVKGRDSTEQEESFRFGTSGDFGFNSSSTLTITKGQSVGVLAVTYKDDEVNQAPGSNRRLIFTIAYPEILPPGMARATPGGRVDRFFVVLRDNENPPAGSISVIAVQ